MSPKEVVENYFARVNAGKWDDFLDLFADDLVMDEQLMGHIEGKAALSKSIAGIRNSPDFRNFPKEIVAEGDRVMAISNVQAPWKDGAKLDLRVATFYRIKNGKIVYFTNFHDLTPFK